MPTINGKVCVVNGTPVDKVLSNGKQVYGRNLYTGTRDFDNPNIWVCYSNWHKATEKFNGLTVMEANFDWFGLAQTIQAKKGETYTFSVYARYENGTGNADLFATPGNGILRTIITNGQVSLNETWQRISTIVTVIADGPIEPRIERSGSTNTLLIAGIKLERGSIATPYSPAPEDVLNGYIAAPKNLRATVIDLSTEKLDWE